jgi:hypothetical protein
MNHVATAILEEERKGGTSEATDDPQLSRLERK